MTYIFPCPISISPSIYYLGKKPIELEVARWKIELLTVFRHLKWEYLQDLCSHSVFSEKLFAKFTNLPKSPVSFF